MINIIKINEIFEDRTRIILKAINEHVDVRNEIFYIAGNALNNTSRKTDIDIFPVTAGIENTRARIFDLFNPYMIINTKNAMTCTIGKMTVQICNYIYPDLKELVESFDYSHIQIGVKIMDNKMSQIHYTQAYLEARIIGNSEYLYSKYPLSSMIRAAKYKEYGEMSKTRMMISIIHALTDVIERGFKDYDDFKDQLDAVDLGLLPEEMKDIEGNKLIKLFDQLRKDK